MKSCPEPHTEFRSASLQRKLKELHSSYAQFIDVTLHMVLGYKIEIERRRPEDAGFREIFNKIEGDLKYLAQAKENLQGTHLQSESKSHILNSCLKETAKELVETIRNQPEMGVPEIKGAVNIAYEKVSGFVLDLLNSCKNEATQKCRAKIMRCKEKTRDTIELYRARQTDEREDFEIAREKLLLEKQTLENKLKHLTNDEEVGGSTALNRAFELRRGSNKLLGCPLVSSRSPHYADKRENTAKGLKQTLENERLIGKINHSPADLDREKLKRTIRVLQGKLNKLIKAIREFMKLHSCSKEGTEEEKSKLESTLIEAQHGFDMKLQGTGNSTPLESGARHGLKRRSADLQRGIVAEIDREKYENQIEQLNDWVRRVSMEKQDLENRLHEVASRELNLETAKNWAKKEIGSAINELNASYAKLAYSLAGKEEEITAISRNSSDLKSAVAKMNGKHCREVEGFKNEKKRLEEDLTRSYERVVDFSEQFDAVWKQKEERKVAYEKEKGELGSRVAALEKDLKHITGLLGKNKEISDEFNGKMLDFSQKINRKLDLYTEQIEKTLEICAQHIKSKQDYIKTIETGRNDILFQLETCKASRSHIQQTLHEKDLEIISLNQYSSLQAQETEALKVELTQLQPSSSKTLSTKPTTLSIELTPRTEILGTNGKSESRISPNSSTLENPKLLELSHQLTLKDSTLQTLLLENELLSTQLQTQTERLVASEALNEHLISSKESTEATFHQLQELLKSEAKSSQSLSLEKEVLEKELLSHKLTLQGLREVLGPHFQSDLLFSVQNLVDSLQLYQPNTYLDPASFSIQLDLDEIPKFVQSDDSSMSSCSLVSIPSENPAGDTSKAKGDREVGRLQQCIKRLERKIHRMGSEKECKGRLQHLKEVIVNFIKLLPKLDEEAESMVKIILTIMEVNGGKLTEIGQERCLTTKAKNKILGLFGL